MSRVLQVTPQDRCLNVMPLFHLHALGSLFASLGGGASLVCMPGFYAPQFFPWLELFQPTWYSAVPTVHQAIVARSTTDQKIVGRAPLRFVRSSSAAMPPTLMADLERVFGVPVIEGYGLVETGLIACNALPPGVRKPGSVGKAAGPEIATMVEDGERLLPTGEVGEIVVRGPGVMPGYIHNPQANAKAFVNGWFRTGDQGYLDQDGYLFITGRLRRCINRGGEKIAPREVEEALMEHPAVAQAVAFALPDAKLGEDVAAIVVLREPKASEEELQCFVGPSRSLQGCLVVSPLWTRYQGRYRQGTALSSGRTTGAKARITCLCERPIHPSQQPGRRTFGPGVARGAGRAASRRTRSLPGPGGRFDPGHSARGPDPPGLGVSTCRCLTCSRRRQSANRQWSSIACALVRDTTTLSSARDQEDRDTWVL